MDATRAKGAFPDEVQKLIETEVFKAFAAIRHQVFHHHQVDRFRLTNMAIKSYTAHLVPAESRWSKFPTRTRP